MLTESSEESLLSICGIKAMLASQCGTLRPRVVVVSRKKSFFFRGGQSQGRGGWSTLDHDTISRRGITTSRCAEYANSKW